MRKKIKKQRIHHRLTQHVEANVENEIDAIERIASVQVTPPVYPFKALTEVGMSFGIQNRTKRQISPHMIKANKTGKSYIAIDCNPATDPDGASVRVFRTK